MIRHATLVATGNTTVTSGPAHGELLYVNVDYDANCDAGTDVTLTDAQSGLTLLSLPNNNTDKQGPVRVQAISTGAVAIANIYECLPLTSAVTLTVAQNAATAVVTVTVWWRE